MSNRIKKFQKEMERKSNMSKAKSLLEPLPINVSPELQTRLAGLVTQANLLNAQLQHVNSEIRATAFEGMFEAGVSNKTHGLHQNPDGSFAYTPLPVPPLKGELTEFDRNGNQGTAN